MENFELQESEAVIDRDWSCSGLNDGGYQYKRGGEEPGARRAASYGAFNDLCQGEDRTGLRL